MSNHVVMGEDSFRCQHCGAEQKMAMPCDIDVMIAASRAYLTKHRRCKMSESGRARFEYRNADEWARSWDTGLSSMAIYRCLKFGVKPGHGYVPHDPADFGRCYRLLEVEPTWRPRIVELGTLSPEWAPYASHWSELTMLYEQELPSGTAPLLYARLQSLAESDR